MDSHRFVTFHTTYQFLERMHFFSNEPISNSITRQLDADPNTPLVKILGDSDVSASIRYEVPQLIDYLTRRDILPELMVWALTREYKDVENSDRLTRAAVLILASTSRVFMERLQDDEIFIQALVKCQSSHVEEDLQIAGHFQRIIEAFVRFTNGGFLSHFPDLCTFLIERVHVLALKELLIRLLTDFSEAFEEEEYEEIAYNLASAAKEKNGYFVATTIRDILKEKKSVVSAFQNDRVIRVLLEAATNPPDSPRKNLYEAELFAIIEKICRNCSIASPLIAEYEAKYEFKPERITCGTIAALRVFKNDITVMFPRFFEAPYITILNSLLFEKFEELPIDSKKKIIRSCNMVNKIMDTWDDHLVNGHLTDLALYLSNHPEWSAALKTPEWETFMREKVEPHDKNRTPAPKEEDKPAGMMSPNMKGKLTSSVSFGGYGGNGAKGISAMVNWAEKQMEKQKAKEVEDEEPSMDVASLLGGGSGLMSSGLTGGLSNGGGTLASGGLSSGGLAAGSTSLKVGMGMLSSGHSFTIPTVYQADNNQQPLVC